MLPPFSFITTTDQLGIVHQCIDYRTDSAEEGVGLRVDNAFYDSFAHRLWINWRFKDGSPPIEWRHEISKFNKNDGAELRKLKAAKEEAYRLARISRHQPDTTGAEL